MSRSLVALIAIVVIFCLGGVAACSTFNSFTVQEKNLNAQYLDNQNNYDNFWKRVKETAQVPDQYTEALQKVTKAAIEGRYGANGSQAVVQMIQEQNPQLDPQLFVKISQLIDSGRTDFEAHQKMLLDKKRIYETSLATFPNNVIAGVMGFPRIDLAKIGIVTSDETEKAFETKKAGALKLKD